MKTRERYRRGYPVAILAALEDDRAVLWKVYSRVVKPEKTVWLEGASDDSKALYNLNERIVNALRPTLKEGVRSVILASPPRTDRAQKFIDHVRRHHAWIIQDSNKTIFSTITGSAATLSEVASLTRAPAFRRLVFETVSEEADNLVGMLEKRLNAKNQQTVVLYSLEEIEDLIGSRDPSGPKPEFLILTDRYLSGSREKNRIHRLLQIAASRDVKTRIVDAQSTPGRRVAQLGGMVCIGLPA